MSSNMRTRYEELKKIVNQVYGSCKSCLHMDNDRAKPPCNQCSEKNDWQNWRFNKDMFEKKVEDTAVIYNLLKSLDLNNDQIVNALQYYTRTYLDHDEVAEMKKRCNEASPGPWVVDNYDKYIFYDYTRPDGENVGPTPIFELGVVPPILEMRGWGHFTGKGVGALGLSDEEGRKRQAANGRFVANCRTDLPKIIQAWEAEKGKVKDLEEKIKELESQLNRQREISDNWEFAADDSDKYRRHHEMIWRTIEKKYAELKVISDQMMDMIKNPTGVRQCSMCSHTNDNCKKWLSDQDRVYGRDDNPLICDKNHNIEEDWPGCEDWEVPTEIKFPTADEIRSCLKSLGFITAHIPDEGKGTFGHAVHAYINDAIAIINAKI